MIIECPKCLAFVEAEEKGDFQYGISRHNPAGRYVLLRCGRCERPILACQDNIGNIGDGDVWDTPTRVFPSQDYANPNAPSEIRQAFEEASSCFRARAYTATAIMCRKTLEGICAHYGVREGSLVSSLRKLKDDAIIDARLHEWSDALRLAGNEAAHDVGVQISQDDAQDMLEFTNAIIDYLFSFRDKFEKFKARRNL